MTTLFFAALAGAALYFSQVYPNSTLDWWGWMLVSATVTSFVYHLIKGELWK